MPLCLACSSVRDRRAIQEYLAVRDELLEGPLIREIDSEEAPCVPSIRDEAGALAPFW